MIPADQTIFGSPNGNCLAACVASLLNIPLETVSFDASGDGGKWFDELNKWLYPQGFYALLFALDNDWRPPGAHILSGRSPRGNFLHAVVAHGNTVVHDPHPSRAGVLTYEDVIVLIPLDPGLRVRDGKAA